MARGFVICEHLSFPVASGACYGYAVRVLILVSALFLLAEHAAAQDVVADDIAPPPLKMMSEDEKSKLTAETQVKRRTRLALQLMELRLKQAETRQAAESFDQMYIELGGFHALMENMLEYLTSSDKDSGRVLNNFKRFEIGLRGFTSRLELIRREVPIRYEPYVRSLIKQLRAARTKAIEPLFDDTVVPSRKPA